MKIVNTRCGWSVSGVFRDAIPTGMVPTDEQMSAFWHLMPGDARFADHARAFPHPRVVLQKLNDNFCIVPITTDVNEVIR